jgi:hypothetical protein
MSNSITTDGDVPECISAPHLVFMRKFVRYENLKAKAILDLFVAAKLRAV